MAGRSFLQVRFISGIPIDLFHKLLHTPKSIYIFGTAMKCVKYHVFSYRNIFIPSVSLCILTVRPVIFVICELDTMYFKFISCDTNDELSCQTKYIISIRHGTFKLIDRTFERRKSEQNRK